MRVFSETQRFNQWLMKVIYLVTIGFLAYIPYTLFIKKEAVGHVAVNDSSGQIIIMGTLVLTLLLFYILKLRTEINEVGVHYQFLPFHFSKQTIRWADINTCYIRKYNPISEYGGWGYRISLGNGKAYNVKGNKGIQIALKTGKKILIGTQKENEAQQIIDRYFKK